MRCLGVLGGESIGEQALRVWAGASDFVVAADGGNRHLRSVTILPNLIVGDMDSIEHLEDIDPKLIHLDREEDRSDLEKLFTSAKRAGAREVVLICAHGGRMDHFLASFSAAIATDFSVRWVLPCEHAVLLRPGFSGVFSTGGAKRLSLIPLSGPCRVTTQGLRWNLDQDELEVGLFWSLSNESVRESIYVEVYGGYLALMVDHLPEVIPEW